MTGNRKPNKVYSVEDIAENLRAFMKETRYGKVEISVHNHEVKQVRQYAEVTVKRSK